MAAPAGYTELGRIGFVDRGTYASGTTYRIGDVVYYNGSTWSALKDNLQGVTPAAGANWKYMARGFAAEALSAITANDTSGVLGTAGASVTSQELIDAIADKVMTKLIEKSKIVNNLLATDATTVLSGPMGKSLDEKITKLNSDLTVKADAANISAQIAISTTGQVVKVPFGKIDNTTIAHLDGGDMVIDIAGWYYTRLNICFSENTNERNYHDYRIVINNAVSVSGIGNIPNPVVGGLTQYPLSDIVYLNKSDRIRIDVIIGKSCNVKLAHTKIVLLRK